MSSGVGVEMVYGAGWGGDGLWSRVGVWRQTCGCQCQTPGWSGKLLTLHGQGEVQCPDVSVRNLAVNVRHLAVSVRNLAVSVRKLAVSVRRKLAVSVRKLAVSVRRKLGVSIRKLGVSVRKLAVSVRHLVGLGSPYPTWWGKGTEAPG